MGAETEGGMWPALTRADKLLALLVVASAIALFLHGHRTATTGDTLLIEVVGGDSTTHRMSSFALLRIAGPLGECQIEIGPEGARVISAPCAQKICMRRGWIWQRGDLAVCVPNGLLLRVAGRAHVDAVVR